MGLGCILCRKPLLNYITPKRVNWAKVNYAKTNGTKDPPSSNSQDQSQQQKPFQVCASTCGHLFHKHCLKTLFGSNK
jgi:hypothetical protein